MLYKSICAAAFFAVSLSVDAEEPKPITIGIARPATGHFADTGIDIDGGVNYRVSQLNAHGGILGRPVIAQFEDDACSPIQAHNVANKMISKDIDIVFGDYCSGATVEAEKVYSEYNVFQITLSQSAGVTHPGHPNLIRFNANADQVAAGMFPIASSFADTTIGIVHEKSGAGKDVADRLASDLIRAGKKVLPADYQEGEMDFSATATALQFGGATLAIVSGAQNMLGPIIRQLRDHGYMGRILMPGTGTIRDIAINNCPAIDGAMAIGVAPDASLISATEKAENETFRLADGAIQAIAIADEMAHSLNPKDIRASFAAANFPTIFGKATFDKDGDWVNARVGKFEWRCVNDKPVLIPPGE